MKRKKENKVPRKEGTISTAEYTEGKWKGLPHFSCNKCPFSTLDEKLMQAHREDHKKRDKKNRRR